MIHMWAVLLPTSRSGINRDGEPWRMNFFPRSVSPVKQSTVALIVIMTLACTTKLHAVDEPQVRLNTDGYRPSGDIDVTQDGSLIRVVWPLNSGRRGQLTFDLTRNRPLIHTAAVSPKGSETFQQIGKAFDPMVQVRVGDRDLQKRGSWTIFFDRMQRKPSELFRAKIEQKRAIVTSNARRATLTIGDIAAGPFQGQMRWTFYAGNSFVLQEAVMKTDRKSTAYLYYTGLVCR